MKTVTNLTTLALLLATSASSQGLFGTGAPREEASPSPWARLAPEDRAALAGPLRAMGELPDHRVGGFDPDTHGSYARFYFDVHLAPGARRALLAVYAKLRAEGLWDEVAALTYMDDGQAKNPDPGICFLPRRDDFQAFLRSRGFGPWNMAAKPDRWGLRSPKVGAELHARGPNPDAPADVRDGVVSIHIDLNNPGRTALPTALPVPGVDPAWTWARGGWHYLEDDHSRQETHSPEAIRRALLEQGIRVPDVDVTRSGRYEVSDFVKWYTGEDAFGHVWLKPRARQAGWWTEGEGARSFDRVIVTGGAYRLRYGNGFLDLWITGEDSVEGRWYKQSDRATYEVEGRRVAGIVTPR